jgi:hypothetical protein
MNVVQQERVGERRRKGTTVLYDHVHVIESTRRPHTAESTKLQRAGQAASHRWAKTVLDHGLNAARGSSCIGWDQHAFEHASS